MGSIGSDVKYSLETRNISHNGFFLDFEKPGRFPFTTSSIMEVWLKLSDSDDSEVVFFNGKMARVVFPDDEYVEKTGPGIAIRIVQIDNDQEKKLFAYIDGQIESKQRDDYLPGLQEEAS